MEKEDLETLLNSLSLWKINVPPKIRTFMWKIASNSMDFGSNLLQRKITDGYCPICRKDIETLDHCFFACSWLKNLWDAWPIFKEIAALPHESFADMTYYLSCHQKFDMETFATILWMIWVERNKLIFNGLPPNARRLNMQAISECLAYQEAWIDPAKTTLLDPISDRWQKPKLNSFKTNVDEGFRNGEGTAGIIVKNRRIVVGKSFQPYQLFLEECPALKKLNVWLFYMEL